MYGMRCSRQEKSGSCKDKRCAFPDYCEAMNIDHKKQIDLLRKIRKLPRVKNVFLGSGVRYDLVMADDKSGRRYLEDVVSHHISGQLKIAPEHTEADALLAMGKPPRYSVAEFRDEFMKLDKSAKKEQFLTYYFIAGHPGCDISSARKLRSYIGKNLKINPRQAQIFTPTPSTFSSLMYHTGRDPLTGGKIFIEKSEKKKQIQKDIISGRS
jgi:uncharacterized radical SAM protein YgiQ